MTEAQIFQSFDDESTEPEPVEDTDGPEYSWQDEDADDDARVIEP